MPRLDRVPRMDARTRRALNGLGSDFVPYTGAVANIDLGAYSIITTGLGTFGNLDVDTLNFNGNVISDSTGTISFSNEHLVTTGSFNAVYIWLVDTGNICIGAATTLDSLTTGNINTVVGAGGAGTSLTDGNGNCLFGYSAGAGLSGDDSVIIGREAGYNQSTPDGLVIIGYHAGYSGRTDTGHTYVGYTAGQAIRGGGYNTFVGYRAGKGGGSVIGTTDGDGVNELKDSTETFLTDNIVKVGMTVLNLTDSTTADITGVADGVLTLDADIFDAAENYQIIVARGGWNVAIGSYALTALTSGNYNVCIGDDAGERLRDGGYNTLIGNDAGEGLIEGDHNICIGGDAGDAITDGSYNIFIGLEAGGTTATGVNGNIAIGRYAGNLGEGNNCIIIGSYAGKYNTSADRFIIDNRDRTNEATEITNAILYGVMAAAQADQKLYVNAACDIGDQTNYTAFAADGLLTMAGTARVTNSIWIDAGGIKAPGAKPATAIAHGTLETPAWQFADQAVAGNQETVSWTMRIPEQMDRTVAPTISIGVSTTTIFTDDATDNETMAFQLEYLWVAQDESTAAAAQETLPVQYTLTAATPAEGLRVLTFTGIDVPSADDVCIYCRLTRLSATTDTIADTIELHGVYFSWTSNKLGTAT